MAMPFQSRCGMSNKIDSTEIIRHTAHNDIFTSGNKPIGIKININMVCHCGVVIFSIDKNELVLELCVNELILELYVNEFVLEWCVIWQATLLKI